MVRVGGWSGRTMRSVRLSGRAWRERRGEIEQKIIRIRVKQRKSASRGEKRSERKEGGGVGGGEVESRMGAERNSKR